MINKVVKNSTRRHFCEWSRKILFWLSVLVTASLFGATGLENQSAVNEEAAVPGERLEPQAVEQEKRQTEIRSDTGSMNFRTGTAVFTGNVTVVDQDVKITSDELTVKLDEENQIMSLEARGNVVIRQDEHRRVARGGHALYTVDTRIMVLMDDPSLAVGDNLLENAYRIVYNMDSELITTEARPGERTTVVIPSARREHKPEAPEVKEEP